MTAKEIKEKGATNLVDALRLVPGILVKNYYGNLAFDLGGYSSVHSERNNIVTLDGVRISEKQATNIPIASIERIEVIPNGGGVLYGDGASGGVVNIISKNLYKKTGDKKVSGEIKTELSSENSYKYGISTNVKITENFIVKADYSKYKLNSWRDNDSEGKLTSRYQNASIGGTYKTNDSTFDARYTRNENQRADGFDLPEEIYKKDRKKVEYSSRDFLNSNDVYLSYRTKLFENTEFLTYANFYENEAKDRKNKKTSEYTKKFFKAQLKYNYSNTNYFIVGADYFKEVGKPFVNEKATGKNTTKIDKGLFLINEMNFGKFTFGQGFRFNETDYKYYWRALHPIPVDKQGKEGEQKYKNYAFNLDLKYNYSDTGMVYGKIARSFRTPIAREMYYTVDATKLKSQVQKTFEIGIKDQIENVFFSASAFYKLTDGEIYYQGYKDPKFPGKTRFPYFNMGDTRRIGLQLLSEQYFDKLTLTESITYLNHKIVSSDFKERKNKEIPMVPNWKLGFAVKYKFNDKLNFNTDFVYVGKFFDSDDPKNERPKDRGNYITVDTSINYDFGNGFAVNARVNNLFNKKYEDYVGYWDDTRQYAPAVGRNYSIGVSYTF